VRYSYRYNLEKDSLDVSLFPDYNFLIAFVPNAGLGIFREFKKIFLF
jgi:hypothetical protein